MADAVKRNFRGMSVFNLSGIVQQRTVHDFDRPIMVVSDRRKRKAAAEQPPPQMGMFWRLAQPLRSSLTMMARQQLHTALKHAQTEKQQHDREKLHRREEAVQRQLILTVEAYAASLELFAAWQSQRITSCAALDTALEPLSPSMKLQELRRQIEMRTVGCGWRQFHSKWGFFTDERELCIDMLRRMLLEDIIPHEMSLQRLRKLPTEAAAPPTRVREVKDLGTADADVLRLEQQSLFAVENLLEKVH